MKAVVMIETLRLILRMVTFTDIAQVASRWELNGPPISMAEAEQKLLWMLCNHAQNAPGRLVHLCLAIIFKETNELIGWCGLDHLNQTQPDPALFYLLQANYWGKGVATEAAKVLLDYAFTQLELSSIHGAAAPENIASKRVMEKIGMKYIGLDAESGLVFRMTRGEYLAFTGWPRNEYAA